MKKQMSSRFFGFVAGVLTAVLIGGIATPALASLGNKTIQVYPGVNIYIDDVKLNPTDVNGDPVEVFIYNGTTYLPVRAVGEAVGKVVQWDGTTRSVYLGKHTGEKPAVWVEDLDYFYGSGYLTQKTGLTDNLGNSYSHTVTGTMNKTYLINGQYSAISGTLFQLYEYRDGGYNNYGTSIEIYGDDKLLYSAEVKGGVVPKDFYVDLTGVLRLRILVSTWNSYDSAGIADFGLWT